MSLPKALTLTEKKNDCQVKSEKPCDGNKRCSCCKWRVTFTVKENIKPENNFQLLKIPVLTESIAYFITYAFRTIETNTDARTTGNVPRVVVKNPLYISNRTLLI